MLSGGMYSAHQIVDHVVAHLGDRLGDVVGLHQLVALPVDVVALIVGDVVVFQKVLADVEVPPSTRRWAFSIELLTMRCSIASPFSSPSDFMKLRTAPA